MRNAGYHFVIIVYDNMGITLLSNIRLVVKVKRIVVHFLQALWFLCKRKVDQVGVRYDSAVIGRNGCSVLASKSGKTLFKTT